MSRPPATMSQQSWLHASSRLPSMSEYALSGNGSVDVAQAERAETDPHAVGEQIEASDPPSVHRVRRHLPDHEANRVRDDPHRVDLTQLLSDEVVALTDVVDHAVEHVLREGFLARGVVVEGAEPDVGRVGDLLDGRRVDTLRGHELICRLPQAQARRPLTELRAGQADRRHRHDRSTGMRTNISLDVSSKMMNDHLIGREGDPR